MKELYKIVIGSFSSGVGLALTGVCAYQHNIEGILIFGGATLITGIKTAVNLNDYLFSINC